jgi:hypothetical protein
MNVSSSPVCSSSPLRGDGRRHHHQGQSQAGRGRPVKAHQIDVTTADHVVTLTGNVDT